MTTQTNGNNLLVQGRIIWGLGSDIFKGKAKTDDNNQPVLAADGSPAIEYGFGLAIPKVDPTTKQPTEEFTKVWAALHQEAYTLYPNGQLPPDFAMKYKDGDGVDHNGKAFADREGYAGHIVLSCTTRIPIKYFIFQGNNNVLVNDGVKCGDYVNVQLNLKVHPAVGRGKPGLYLNPGSVQLIQSGKEIINSPSGDQIFGQVAPANYAGEVVAPVVAAMPTTPVAPVAPAPHYAVVPETLHPAAPPVAPVAPVAPVNPAAPTTPGMPTMPGMPVVR